MKNLNILVTREDRRHSVQCSNKGDVTVFVHDLMNVNSFRFIHRWQFTFRPEPGDILAQVTTRLGE